MAAMDFPPTPTVGQLYPDPPTVGVPQYRWDGGAWLAVSTPEDLSYVRRTGDTMTGLLTLSDDPTVDLHAVPKRYVDGGVSGIPGKVSKSGDTMTGPLVLPGDPTLPLHAATKQYADASKKNYLVNGAMQISQEAAGFTVNINGAYPADQWAVFFNGASVLFSQAVTAITPAGAFHKMRITLSPADASIAAGDYYLIFQRIEASRMVDLKWGTPSARTVTLQFGWKAPAGTYGICIANHDTSRNYLTTFAISAGQADTDTVQTIVIPGDTAGTWNRNPGQIGMHVQFTFSSGRVGVAGWQGAGAFDTAPGITNNMTSTANVFDLFDVGLYAGNIAPPFTVPEFISELELCQRYYEKSYNYNVKPGTVGAGGASLYFTTTGATANGRWGTSQYFQVRKPFPPTITIYSPVTGVANAMRDAFNGVDIATSAGAIVDTGFTWLATPSAGVAVDLSGQWTAVARL